MYSFIEKIKRKLEQRQKILLGRLGRVRKEAEIFRTRSEVMSILKERSEQQIEEIEDALIRMETGSFGLCEICNEPIHLEHLEAIPTATFCNTCQKQNEQD